MYDVDPLTGAVVPTEQQQGRFNRIADALGAGLRNWVETPGRAYKQGLTREEMADWGAGTALGMVGGARLPGGAPAGAVGSSGAKLVQPEGIRAYHGSPYDFDKFSLQHIGKGEGAQAYGHGLYFAEKEGTARSYRDQLGGQPKVGGKDIWENLSWMRRIERDHATGALKEALARGLTGDDAVHAAMKSLNEKGHGIADNFTRQPVYDAANNLAPLLGKQWETPPGRMYEVNIGAKPEQFLDWDRPLRDQPVAETVRSLVPQDIRKSFDYNVDKGNIPGSNAYFNYVPSQSFPIRDSANSPWRASGASSYEDALALVGGDTKRVNRLLTPDKAASSQRLAEAGIPGIRYLDQGSRGAGQGTHNYVVFDDSLIDILRKYGIAGIAPAGLAAAAATEQSQDRANGGPVHMANGGLGASPHVPFYVRNMSRQSTAMPKGLIASPVAGRTDRLNMNTKPNSYVIPADVVSGLGQGNTLAGGRILDAMLKSGPYGSAKSAMPRGGAKLPRAPMPKGLSAGGMAEGEEDVPIVAAGGEYVAEPEVVAALGGGDIEKGHKILDQMVLSIRKQVIKQLEKLPGPAR